RPGGGPLKQSDMWWKVNAEGRWVGVAVWAGSAWVDRQMVADSVLVPGSVGPVLIEDGAVTATKIAGDAIDGKTVTGATIRTAPSGQRMQFDANGLRAFNLSGQQGAALYSGGGSLALSGGLSATGDAGGAAVLAPGVV